MRVVFELGNRKVRMFVFLCFVCVIVVGLFSGRARAAKNEEVLIHLTSKHKVRWGGEKSGDKVTNLSIGMQAEIREKREIVISGLDGAPLPRDRDIKARVLGCELAIKTSGENHRVVGIVGVGAYSLAVEEGRIKVNMQDGTELSTETKIGVSGFPPRPRPLRQLRRRLLDTFNDGVDDFPPPLDTDTPNPRLDTDTPPIRGWTQTPPIRGWTQTPPIHGWTQTPPIHGWTQTPPIHGWTQ
ncbi:MAG: hypothetical protein LBU29_01815, partial [Endomicrobium sp.]|nr:hypothetical protein [Endomicrobium sp.]